MICEDGMFYTTVSSEFHIFLLLNLKLYAQFIFVFVGSCPSGFVIINPLLRSNASDLTPDVSSPLNFLIEIVGKCSGTNSQLL